MDAEEIRDLLQDVTDPDLGGDIVSLNLVNDIDVDGETVHVDLALGAPFASHESEIADDVRDVLEAAGLEPELSASLEREVSRSEDVLPDVTNIIAVASGKGGVGKSTIAVNLAAGLAEKGAQVGLFDADIYGPNVPHMVDAQEPPEATPDETLVPPEKYGMKLMSMAFLVGEEDPVIWRGPMVDKMLNQFWDIVEWGELDYMIVDLPPGTGDTQLSLLQSVPVTGAVIVTTPQEVALADARKGLEMFGTHETPVIGIAENMGTFVCPDCDSQHAIFGEGGGKRFAEEHEMPFLGSIPLDTKVREGGDAGQPIVLEDDSTTGNAFRTVTETVANNVGIINRRRQSEE
ncbi:MAG: ATP-binding protein involved in chromosome partitioning [Halobacteriales archaeon]|jgi:ATP-binding protein involved in chromosome partitioning